MKFKKKYFMVDSQAAKEILQKESYGFNTFVVM